MNNEINDLRFKKILFTQSQIEEKIKEMATWVNKEYKNSQDLVLVGLLKGCIPFLAQLIKNIDIDHCIDFMIATSYKGKTKPNNNVKIVMDLASDIQGKDVLIVEDIIDSGKTLKKVVDNLKQRQPNSIKIITLLYKKENLNQDIKPDQFGFEVENEFLVGFGLDIEEKLRNLPYIGVFDIDYWNKEKQKEEKEIN